MRVSPVSSAPQKIRQKDAFLPPSKFPQRVTRFFLKGEERKKTMGEKKGKKGDKNRKEAEEIGKRKAKKRTWLLS